MREASCWNVEVMNGAGGVRRCSLVRTSSTAKAAPWRASRSASASWPVRIPRLEAASIPRPASIAVSRSILVGTLRSPIWISVARKLSPASVASRAARLQYSIGTNARISRSRSTMRRSAGDWTLPADRP